MAIGVEIDATIDAWLGVRVAAHRAREVRAIDVPLYLAALRAVRHVEDLLEPIRRANGATSSRAYELATTSEQLLLEVA